MFEQDVPVEGKLELDVLHCRGHVRILGHDAPALRVLAEDPKTEYRVHQEDSCFRCESSGPLRIDVPSNVSLEVIISQYKVSVENMEAQFTISSAGQERALDSAGAAATAFAREFSDVGRRLGKDFGRLGRDLGEQFGRSFSAPGRENVGGGRPNRGSGINVDAFIRRAEEGAEKFVQAAEDQAERFVQRAEGRIRGAAKEADRAEQRDRRPTDGSHLDMPKLKRKVSREESGSAVCADKERRMVLTLLQEGKISTEKAEELLNALQS